MDFQESETVELKSTVVDDIKKEIIALGNSNGGKLYIGVSDNGDVIGLDDILMGVSVYRNRNLASVFYRLRLIEAYGTGMRKIFGAYSKKSLQPKSRKNQQCIQDHPA